jgi:hypothetical protein
MSPRSTSPESEASPVRRSLSGQPRSTVPSPNLTAVQRSCFIAADSHGIPTAVRAAAAWDGKVLGMALGHARLSDRTQGERAPVNRAIWEAMGQLLKNDYGAFVRTGLAQLTQGSLADDLTRQMLERVPRDIALAAYDRMMSETESIEPLLRELDVPLLFAKHEGCIAATEEAWEDAVAAFPDALTISVPLDPTVSEGSPRQCVHSVLALSRPRQAKSKTEAPSALNRGRPDSRLPRQRCCSSL